MRIRRSISATALATITAIASLAAPSAVAVAQIDDGYYLPAPLGTELIVTSGNGESDGRRGNEEYAWDLSASGDSDDAFIVLAARGGTVIGSRGGVRNGRCREPLSGQRPACWRAVNYVLIDHGDGTSGLYMHLAPGLTVRRGEVVARGTALGRAGRTGWTRDTGVQFQVERTPPLDERGSRGWFLTRSQPVTFSDPSVLDVAPDGVPRTDDVVVSANPGTTRDPFTVERRPARLPAVVPFAAGEERQLVSVYQPDDPDGYGLTFATDPSAPSAGEADPDASPDDPVQLVTGTAVRPIFGGDLVFAGCATGDSASLGLTVVIRRDVDAGAFYGVHGNLSDVDPALLAADLSFPPSIGANDTIGHYGGEPSEADTLCPAADPGADDLFVGILAEATVSEDGEIRGGTPVSPEPLLGRGGYDALPWWDDPIESRTVDDLSGRPRVGWNRRTPATGTTVTIGTPVALVTRVRDEGEIHEVRFRVYYPDWPRPNALARFPGFDPAERWRVVAVCRPPGASGEPSRSDGCDWDGDASDAIVSFSWDPAEPETTPGLPWLPRARVTVRPNTTACVPVALGVEMLNASGQVRSNTRSTELPTQCDDDEAEAAGRVVYLEPLVPPPAPGLRAPVEGGQPIDRGWPARFDARPDPLNGAIAWRDRSDNEEGFRIFARSSWFDFDCSLIHSSWRQVATVGPGVQRYRPRHNQVSASLPNEQHPDVPGTINRWEYAVASYNAAGQSTLRPVGGFVGGGEAFCDPGLEGPAL